jgi:hypothetical protein
MCTQLGAEIDVITRFFNLADACGLPLPEDSQETREALRQLNSQVFEQLKENWPPLKLLSLIAIAQHHGVPTRLLDWTRSSRVAAYFAASGAWRHTRKERELWQGTHQPERLLSVWAFDHAGLSQVFSRNVESELSCEYPIITVTAPRAHNPNLHAQSGIFTMVKSGHFSDGSVVDRTSLNDRADELVSAYAPKFTDRLFFRHFTLPRYLAFDLLKELLKEGVSAADLFPGYGGVVRAMSEGAYW